MKKLLKKLITKKAQTRRELLHKLGLAYNSCNDRQLREWLSQLKKELPIISLSSGRGYRLAKNAEDAKIQIRENNHRAKEILKNNLGLKKYLQCQQEL